MLQSPELYRDHILIAVDLPGYGGSDSLPSYGPYEMLEAITEFILGMREQFLQSDMKTVVVAHDWGAIIAARLACEASELADYWVIMSGMIVSRRQWSRQICVLTTLQPTLARSNAQAQMALAKKMLHTWIRSPSNFRLLRTAFEAVGPLRSQFSHSFYIFCFLLPWPFGNMLATFGNFWLLRVMHSLGKGGLRKGGKIIGRLGPKEAGEAMAMSTGPGLQQLDGATSSSLRYGESVRRRVADRGMSEKVKIYRDNLFAGKWDKSLETTAALVNIASSKPRTTTSSGPLIHGLKDGRYLKAPITFLLGERDPAFNKRVVLDNFKDIMHGGGQVVTIKNAGHWLPLEAESRRVVERTVAWVLRSGEQGYIPFAEMSSVNTVTEV